MVFSLQVGVFLFVIRLKYERFILLYRFILKSRNVTITWLVMMCVARYSLAFISIR